MTRGIPQVPQDGEQYSSLGMAGLPTVLEYDSPTGGWKQVISTEQSVAILVSGTVEIEAGQFSFSVGSQYGEDTPHVSNATGTFIMGVRRDVLSGYVSADGDYAGLNVDREGRLYVNTSGTFANTEITTPQALGTSWLTANPVVGTLGVFPGMFMFSSGNWQNIEGWQAILPAVRGVDFNNLLGTQSVMLAEVDGAATSFDSLQIDPGKNLRVTMISGSFNPAEAVRITGSVVADTEITTPAILTTQYAGGNPTVGMVGTFPGVYMMSSDNWGRLEGWNATYPAVRGVDFQRLLGTQSIMLAEVDGAPTNFDSLQIDPIKNLHVTLVSGSFPAEAFDVQVGAVEIKDSDSDRRAMVGGVVDSLPNPTGIYVGAFPLAFDVANGDWGRNRSVNPGPSVSAGYVTQSLVTAAIMHAFNTGSSYSRLNTHPLSDVVAGNQLNWALNVGSYMMGYNPYSSSVGHWQRIQIDPATRGLLTSVTGSVDTEITTPALLSTIVASGDPTVGFVGSYDMMWDFASDQWWRQEGFSPTYPVAHTVDFQQIQMVQGISLAENAAGTYEPLEASALSDLVPNPNNALEVGAFNMVYNGSTYERVYAGLSGSMSVDLATRLDAANDEVTAYVTGTINANLVGGDIEIGAVEIKDALTDDRLNVTADGRAQVNSYITGSTTLGDALTNPTVAGIGAYSLIWNADNGQWVRGGAALPNTDTIPVGSTPFAQQVLSVLYGRREVSATSRSAVWTHREQSLYTSMPSGSFPRESVDPDNNLRVTLVNSSGTSVVDTELSAAIALGADVGSPTTAPVGSFGYSREGTVSAGWEPNRAYYVQTGGLASIPYTDVSPSLHVFSTVQGIVPAAVGATADIENIISVDNALSVTMASGTFAAGEMLAVTGTVDTELPPALALGDFESNFTTPTVGAALSAYDEGNNEWNRMRSVAPTFDGMPVADASPMLAVGSHGILYDPVADDFNRMRGSIEEGVQVTLASGSAPSLSPRSPLSAPVIVSGSTSLILVPGVPGQTVNVVGYQLISSATQELYFLSGTGSLRSGPMALAANTQLQNGPSNYGEALFSSNVGEGIQIIRNVVNPALGGYINYYYD